MRSTQLALAGIDGYRRYLSPIKGFRCAHAAFFGGPSCSEAIRAIVELHGVRAGRALIAARFAACRSAHHHLHGAAMRTGWFASGDVRAQGVCCCGGIPIPFRCG